MARSIKVAPASGSTVRHVNMRMHKFLETLCEHDIRWVDCKFCEDRANRHYVTPEKANGPEPAYLEWGRGQTIVDRFDPKTGKSYIRQFRSYIETSGVDISDIIVDFRAPSQKEMLVYTGASHEQQWVRLCHPVGPIRMMKLIRQFDQAWPFVEMGREKKFKRVKRVDVSEILDGKGLTV